MPGLFCNLVWFFLVYYVAGGWHGLRVGTAGWRGVRSATSFLASASLCVRHLCAC